METVTTCNVDALVDDNENPSPSPHEVLLLILQTFEGVVSDPNIINILDDSLKQPSPREPLQVHSPQLKGKTDEMIVEDNQEDNSSGEPVLVMMYKSR